MDKFDALSNNELREELKSRGLGNFPVTDTTRNALIKKLRNAVNGPAKPAKGRRETMMVVKHSSAEESESDADAKKLAKSKTVTSRRATIAASAPKIVQNPTVNLFNGISIEKVAAKPVVTNIPTAVRSKSPSRKTIVAPEPVSYFADASDDDLIAAAEEAEKITKASRKTRSSRSPSLTKSSVVTTSYKHIIEPLIEHKNDLAMYDHSDAEYHSEMLDKIRKPSTPTTKITSNAQDNRRKTLHIGPSISTNFSSIKPVELATPEDKTSAYRRYTSLGYNSPAPTRESDDDILKKVETPFLSNFTRRLAELKAEPLPGAERDDSEPIYKKLSSQPSLKTSYSARTYDGYRPSRVDYRFQPEKPESKWSVWEKKIRWPLFILIALFVGVALYVFLFSNN